MFRWTAILTSAALVALAGSLPAAAAMPVAGLHTGTGSSDLVQVQAKKKKSARTARQKEIDSSIDSGTVPKRYRSSVPKQYHHLIPFAR